MYITTTRRATRWITAAMLPTLFATLLAACGGGGDSTPPPATGNVGPAGATVTSSDQKATLTVPAGAIGTTIDVALTPTTEGFAANPLIVPGTTYRLDAPDTALATEATLEITVPAGALDIASASPKGPALASADPRPHTPALQPLTLGNLIVCGTPPVAAVPPSVGTVCYFVANKFDDPGTSPGAYQGPGSIGNCPTPQGKAIGATDYVGHFFMVLLIRADLSIYNGYVDACEVPAPPAPQIANVAITPPGQFAALLNTAKDKLSIKINLLSHGVYAMLFDKVRPVVQISSTVTPTGGGMGTLTLAANATDDVGVVKLALVKWENVVDPVTQVMSVVQTGLAQFVTSGTNVDGTWTSPPMPLSDIYGRYYVARAWDAAGNKGANVVSVFQGAPTIASFSASPVAVAAGGGMVTLSWSSANAVGLSIDNGVGDVTGLSSKTVNVTTPTTFTLTAANPAGTVTATTAVTVNALPAPTITSFTATPASLPPGGGNVTLNWVTTDATSVSIDNGIGVVTGTSKVVNVAANTTFTLTATNTSGSPTKQTNVVVATTVDRFVDPVAGLDTSACTQAAPCKTIGKAMTGAPSASTVYLADGSYPSSNSATIPDGVALRATHPGAAILNFVTLTATGSASLNGLVFDIQGQSCSSISAASTTGTPTLAITGVLFKCAGVMNIGGSVKAVMTPGPLANGQYTALPSLGSSLLSLSGTAELLIQGGNIDFNNFGQGQYGPGMFNTTGSSKLTLDAVTVRNLKPQAFVIAGSNTVVLRNFTVIDHVGDAGDCAAGGAIVVSGGGTLSMDHATVSNGSNAAICIGAGTTQLPTIQLTQSTISGMAGSAIATAQINGPNGNLTADGLALINNVRGMYLLSGASPALSLTLSNLTVTGNTAGGITLSNGALTLRSSTLSNNGAEGGLTLYGSAAADLGTAASPGGNTFIGNSGPQLNSIVDAGRTVNAVGNVWTPSVQGADANGRYSLPPTFTPVPKFGPTTGSNFQIYNASTLNL